MAATRGRKSNQELGEAITATLAMITFAQEKAVEFFGRYTQDLAPAEKALATARSSTAQSIMDLGIKAHSLASAAGYDGLGEKSKLWSLVPRYYNALLNPFEVRLKELSAKENLAEAMPSYPVMKSEVLGHMKQGPYILTIEKRADGSLIPSDERKISTGNPKDTGGYSDMVSRTKKVRGYTRKVQTGSQAPESASGTAAAGTEDRIAVGDKIPQAVQKATNDLLREINAVPRWTERLASRVIIALGNVRKDIGEMKPEGSEVDMADLPDAKAPSAEDIVAAAAGKDTAMAQAMAKAKQPRRSRSKRSQSLKDAA